MSWAYVGGNKAAVGSSSSTTLTYTIVNSGALLAVAVVHYQGHTKTITDTLNNSWYRVAAVGTNTNERIEIWYAIANTSGSTTLTITPYSAAYITANIDEFTFGSGLVQVTYSQNNNGSSTTPSSGNLTIGSSSLVYAAVAPDGTVSGYTAGTGYTLTENTDFASGSHIGLATEYKLNTSTSPEDPGFTFTTSQPWQCLAVAFTVVTAGSWSLVQGTGSTVGTATTCAATFPQNVTANNLMVVMMHIISPGTVSIADSHSNTYTQQTTSTSGTDNAQIWTAPVTTGGSNTVTVTLGANTNAEIFIGEYAYSGGATFALDHTAAGGNGTSTAPSPGSCTVSGTDLVLACCGDLVSFSETVSPQTSFGTRWFQPKVTSVCYGFAAQDYLGATTNQTGSFTLEVSAVWIAVACSIKPTPSGGGSAFRGMSFLRPYAPADIQYAWRD
jgi:hypothetical protein